MKFLVDVHHVGGQQTGNETWARNVARELAVLARSDTIRFAATPAGAAEVATLVDSEPLTVSSASTVRLLRDLPRAARAADADALLVHYTPPLTRRPLVVVVHDISFVHLEASDWLPFGMRLRLRAALRNIVRRGAVVLTPSEFTRDEILRRTGAVPTQIRVAPNAVDPELARLISGTRRTRRRGERPRVLVVGNVLPRKNLLTVAEAAAALEAQGSPVGLRVVGRVPDEGREVFARVSAAYPATSWAGYRSLAELAQEYVDADLLAFPSLYEGFGIPVIEAMSAGLPVAVSDRACLPEIAGPAGDVVPATDVRAWVETIRRLTTAGDAGGVSERARSRAAEFSWAATAKVVLDALQDAGRSSGRRPASKRSRSS